MQDNIFKLCVEPIHVARNPLTCSGKAVIGMDADCTKTG